MEGYAIVAGLTVAMLSQAWWFGNIVRKVRANKKGESK